MRRRRLVMGRVYRASCKRAMQLHVAPVPVVGLCVLDLQIEQ